jgi:uncharacterized protein YndB with AHSA1/START domain
MAYYRAQLDVRRPIDEVFAYLADFSNTQEWDPGVVSAKKRGGGPVTVGTQFEVVSKFLGQELPLDYQIVQYDPPNRLVLEAENDNLRSVDTVTFEKTARALASPTMRTSRSRASATRVTSRSTSLSSGSVAAPSRACEPR